jgi:hypothetical protein
MDENETKKGVKTLKECQDDDVNNNEIEQQYSASVGKIRQIRTHAVTVPYFTVTVTIRCDWMRRTKTMGSHFNVTACRVGAVSFPLIRNLVNKSRSE